MFENILKKISILYIDDLINNNKDLLSKLEANLANLYLSSTDLSPTLQFNECNPDIVIININLNDFDTVEIIKNIRENDPHMPIFVISSEDDVSKCINTIAMDISGYIVEPITSLEFIDKIVAFSKKFLCEVEKRDYAKIFQNVINSDNWLVVLMPSARL